MKNILFLLSAAVFVIMMSATYGCQKSDPVEKIVKDTIRLKDTVCPVIKGTITGLWEGTYTTNQVSHAPSFISFSIHPDGTITRRAKIIGRDEFSYTKGRWSLTGTAFYFKDTAVLFSGGNIVQDGKLVFSDSTMVGTWTDLAGQSYTGTYPLMKKVK